MSQKNSRIWIVTGPIQVGKTYFCRALLEQANLKGLNVAGIICPPVFENGQKIAISIENLKTHELKTLATRRNDDSSSLHTFHWNFDEQVMAWGNQILAETAGCDLLLVDELGPLEFNRGEGWQNGLKAIDAEDYQIAVVVIRPALMETAQKRWPLAKVNEITSGLSTEEIQQQIAKIFKSSSLQ